MKWIRYALVSVLFAPFLVQATIQVPDVIKYQGETFLLGSNPLEGYLNRKEARTICGVELTMTSTACYRGYIATWKVDHDSLFLIKINKGGDNLDLINEFGTNRVFAYWVTGKLILPKGEIVHLNPESSIDYYKFELGLIIRDGKIIDKIKYDNSKSYHSTLSNDEILKFIMNEIDWSIVPSLDTEVVKVFIELQSGTNPIPDSVKIVKASSYEVLNKEAFRVIQNIPEWSTFYRQGEVYRLKWVVPVTFSEELRKTYH